jgi:SOS-response transcriptional repressor LexA
MSKVTQKQRRVLQEILDFTKENRYPPTVRELGQALGISSSSTVQGFLERLKIHGLVTWEQGCPRTLKVVDQHEKITS